MKNKLKLIIGGVLVALTLTVSAQTNAPATTNLPAPTILGGLQEVWSAAGSATNWVAPAYGLYAPALKNKYGGGVGYFYSVSTYVSTGIRIDSVNGSFWMPSGSATLQLPLHPLSRFTSLPAWLSEVQITPLAYAGIGLPLSGAVIGSVTVPGKVPTDNNGEATAIIGQGVALQVYAPTNGAWNIDVVADRETWSGFSGTQYRVGGAFHLKF